MMLTSCTEDDDNGPAHPGLGIKTFFPTKVVTNQPMTINGSGFTDVIEIEFPGGAKVTNFEIVSDDMIRVDAPSGIATEGGKIVLRSANGQVESRQPLTVGHTQVTGFSKQPGETAAGGELITVFGTDLEFINAVELLDADSVPQLIDHQDFYRKGTSNLVFRVPLKNIYKGTFEGILHTYDGQRISMPELTYEPAADEGHWETVKTVIWQNNGAGAVSWNGTYRFALEGHDGANECIAEIPQDIWDRMMTETFYLDIEATDPQVRITNGWWDSNWKDDIQPGNELLTDNGDGTWTVAISVADNPAYVATLLEKHILFTGDRYTPIQIYFEDQKWVDGGGHTEIVKTSIWKGDGSAGAVSWSSQYRFSSANNVTGEEIYAIPMDIWEKMKTSTFYLDLEATDPQIRVTTGWWTTTWTGDDIFPGNEHLTDNGDGTFTLEINLSGDAALLDLLDVQHLLFTGDRYTPLEIYFREEVWVDGGGGSSASEVVIWQGDGSAGAVSWSGQYRFSSADNVTGEEIYAIPMDQWNIIKTSTFYLDLEATDPQIRVTTGWWTTTWTGDDIFPGNEHLTDNGDGTFTLEVNLSGDAALLDLLDVQHLLFTGDRYTPRKLYYYE